MVSLTLLFSADHSPISWLIRTVTWSRWSHVAIVDGDTVIEAVPRGDVQRNTLTRVIGESPDHALVSLPVSAPEKIVAAARSQLGKPYDWTAIAGLGLRRNWQQDDAWFCSELVAWAAAAAGDPWFRCEALHRVQQILPRFIAP